MSDSALPVLRGTLDLLVLKALVAAPAHGFEISRWIESHSHGALGIEDSALYQSLYRLEGRKLIRADWGVTENNRRARYYALTALGRRQLHTETAQWVRYANAVTGILTAPVKGS